MQSICDCFSINLTIYFGNDRFIFQPSFSTPTYLNAQLYLSSSCYAFDSVTSINVSPPYQLPSVPTTKTSLRMSTWNVRGATDVVKRNLIDFELNKRKITICAIQESHLWSHSLSTANYKWMLGPQSQTRASRGLGFIVHRSLLSHDHHISFPNTNIGIFNYSVPGVI